MNFDDETIRNLVGRADTCELLSRAFTFPTEELAQALHSGAFQEDLASCLMDAGVRLGDVKNALIHLNGYRGENERDLLHDLQVSYSLMYLQPGGHTPIFPFEGAFLHVTEGKADIPALFQTRTTLDVEQRMREAGVVPKNALREPCDHMSCELELLAYLYGCVAQALYEGRDGDRARYAEHARSFVTMHLSRWAGNFFAQTANFPEAGPYADIAQAAVMFVHVLEHEG